MAVINRGDKDGYIPRGMQKQIKSALSRVCFQVHKELQGPYTNLSDAGCYSQTSTLQSVIGTSEDDR